VLNIVRKEKKKRENFHPLSLLVYSRVHLSLGVQRIGVKIYLSLAAFSMVFQIIDGFLHEFKGQNRSRKISGKSYSGDVEDFNDLLP
jgi:hypothetical protein